MKTFFNITDVYEELSRRYWRKKVLRHAPFVVACINPIMIPLILVWLNNNKDDAKWLSCSELKLSDVYSIDEIRELRKFFRKSKVQYPVDRHSIRFPNLIVEELMKILQPFYNEALLGVLGPFYIAKQQRKKNIKALMTFFVGIKEDNTPVQVFLQKAGKDVLKQVVKYTLS